MQNKKLILILGALILFVGAAPFLGGRFLNQTVDPAGSISVTIVPAGELPQTSPEVTGSFVEQRDNSIIVESRSLHTGGAVAIPAAGTTREGGPRVEMVVTSGTIIYRETTQLSAPLSEENRTIQQTVEEASLEDLGARSMLMVWGRKSGDRITAEVLMYSDIVAIKGSIFEDCEICP